MSTKTSLDLLRASYDSSEDSSDSEVPGCKVSTKRTLPKDFEEKEKSKHVKAVERLPFPSILIPTKFEVEDNPEAHDGRARTFAHERGNWSTFVFIKYEGNSTMNNLISKVIECSQSVAKLKPSDDLHISLTRTVVLKYHWIEPFAKTVQDNICNVGRFVVLLSNVKIYCNEERTRTFIGLRARTGYDSLVNVVEILDKCLAEFRLQSFYENPSFHMSIAWCVGDKETELNSILPFLESLVQEYIAEHESELSFINVNSFYCKIGNKLFRFPVL